MVALVQSTGVPLLTVGALSAGWFICEGVPSGCMVMPDTNHPGRKVDPSRAVCCPAVHSGQPGDDLRPFQLLGHLQQTRTLSCACACPMMDSAFDFVHATDRITTEVPPVAAVLCEGPPLKDCKGVGGIDVRTLGYVLWVC